MKNNIIVTSNGFINKVPITEEMIQLFKSLVSGKKVLIIDNAASSLEVSSNYKQRICVQENFLKVGANICDIATLDSSNTSIIQDYDVVYMLGGNITSLLNFVNATDFKEQLLKFLERGVYIGESAGSMILCHDLEYSYEIMDGTGSKYDRKKDLFKSPISYKGLGLIDKIVIPDYNDLPDELKRRIRKYPSSNIITLEYNKYFSFLVHQLEKHRRID